MTGNSQKLEGGSSPREVLKTSLLMQKKGSKSSKLEYPTQMVDPRTSTVIKHVQQASKQNLMIVQNESQLGHTGG
jgi:hypothetical protein